MAESDVLSKLERYQEALAAYEQVIALDPTFAGAYEDKGDSLLKLGRYEEALTAYEQALRADSDNAHVCYKVEKYRCRPNRCPPATADNNARPRSCLRQ